MILNTFSDSCGYSYIFFGKTHIFIQSLCPFLDWIVWFLLLSCISALYLFWNVILLIRYMVCKYFPQFHRSPFHCVDCSLCLCRSISLWCSPTSSFLLLLLVYFDVLLKVFSNLLIAEAGEYFPLFPLLSMEYSISPNTAPFWISLHPLLHDNPFWFSWWVSMLLLSSQLSHLAISSTDGSIHLTPPSPILHLLSFSLCVQPPWLNCHSYNYSFGF